MTKLLSEQVEYFLAEEWGAPDEVTKTANIRLHEFGGEKLLLSRMSSREKRLWRPSTINLDAGVFEEEGREPRLVLLATRETLGGKLGQIGVYTVIGRRVNGNSTWVQPIEAPSDLAHAVNGMLAWRDSLEH
jgi:hypothetical protein